MNINASIIDQQITGLMKQDSYLPSFWDENKKRSAYFVVLCMKHFLCISMEESLELLTEGGNDAGVDGLHIGDVDDGEFLVTIFQGKYKIKLDGTANFPESSVQKSVGTVRVLFNPSRNVAMNEKLKPKVEEIRSFIRDGYIPNVRIVLCNNGDIWNQDAQVWINDLKKDCRDKVEFVHFNHDSIVQILQRTKSVNATLQFNGKLIVEDMNHMRVLIGRISVNHIAGLFEQHGDLLLQRNIRRYLGLRNNRVNSAIHETLCSKDRSDKFYFYNNGITVICDKFSYNAFQDSDYTVTLDNMQIINGGQTCKTIHETLNDKTLNMEYVQSAYVMIRIYQLSEESKEFVRDITYATNSQNPVDLRDLRSNDKIQQQLEVGMKTIGYTYRRQRHENKSSSSVISSSMVAEATLAIWREQPHQAKFRRREHFGKLYKDIFDELNAAQAVLAVLIFRNVEKKRKRSTEVSIPIFIPYASHYLSMLIGRQLLYNKKVSLSDVSLKTFNDLLQNLQDSISDYYIKAVDEISNAIIQFYGNREISLQQYSATFRRGDLLDVLTEDDL